MAREIYVIGGGASGYMAAITAAGKGARVTILEQNDKPLKKLLATGNGRCNLTNRNMELSNFRGDDTGRVSSVLARFDADSTIRFFEELGICITDKNGWIYPRSMQAAQVAKLLISEAERLGIRVRTGTKVLSIVPGSRSDRKMTIEVSGFAYKADAVILCAGSRASDISGADGSGYDLAEHLGHRIRKPLPALTGLYADRKFSWSGVRTSGRIEVFAQGKLLAHSEGELQLTDYGVSGIPVFQVSRYALRSLDEGQSVTARLDFMPELSFEDTEEFFRKRKEKYPKKTSKEFLTGIFPDKLIDVLSRQKDLVKAVKQFEITLRDHKDYKRAQVCQGGVLLSETDDCFASKRAKGVYFAGEILDIDGACGGYNLQWAWSTGFIAGTEAAKGLE